MSHQILTPADVGITKQRLCDGDCTSFTTQVLVTRLVESHALLDQKYRRTLWMQHGCPIAQAADDPTMRCGGRQEFPDDARFKPHGPLDFQADTILDLETELAKMKLAESGMKVPNLNDEPWRWSSVPMKVLVPLIIAVGLTLAPLLAKAEDLTNVQWLDCHDGDTCAFNVLLPAVFGTDIGVRLSGIDTPEIAGKCLQEKQRAAAARDFLKSQIKGAKVVLQSVFRDKYFRIEAVVLANDVNVNQLMVQKGYAVLYTGQGPKHDWCAP